MRVGSVVMLDFDSRDEETESREHGHMMVEEFLEGGKVRCTWLDPVTDQECSDVFDRDDLVVLDE